MLRFERPVRAAEWGRTALLHGRRDRDVLIDEISFYQTPSKRKSLSFGPQRASKRLYDHKYNDADHQKRGDLVHDSPVARRLFVAVFSKPAGGPHEVAVHR